MMLRGISKLSHTSFVYRTGNGVFFQSGRFASFVMKVPGMGDSITEGSIFAWTKKVGDLVVADEVLCQIETDKVTIDVHSQVSGKVIAHAAEPGGTVFVNGDLCTIDTDAAASSNAAPAKSEAIKSAAPPVAPSTVSTLSHKYNPMIKFPVRGAASHAIPAAPKATVPTAASTPSSKAPTVKSGQGKFGADTVEVYSSWSDLPAKFRGTVFSETEIDCINMGGMSNDEWTSIVVQNKNKSAKKEDKKEDSKKKTK